MKNIKRVVFAFLLVGIVFIFVSCSGSKYNFKYWNNCDSLTNLEKYVENATNEKSDNYIPVEDRIAVFDMDGTLYGELFPAYFEYLLYAHRVLDDNSYKDATPEMIEAANAIRNNKYTWNMGNTKGLELAHANGQAKAFAGMTEDEFMNYVKEFAKTNAEGFNNLTYATAQYKPMIEVVDYLQKNNFKTYVVSGSDRFICRVVACEAFNIPSDQVIGMDTTIVGVDQDKDGLEYQLNHDEKVVKGDELLIKNLKMNKVIAITREIGKQPVLAFGNSSGDVSMLNYAMNNKKYKGEGYMLIADDTDRDYANMEETNNRKAQWEENKYNIISMKNDFKTIYGENVVKTN